MHLLMGRGARADASLAGSPLLPRRGLGDGVPVPRRRTDRRSRKGI